jgi:folylpolyglutamate synthase/dihydropteroate synthase
METENVIISDILMTSFNSSAEVFQYLNRFIGLGCGRNLNFQIDRMKTFMAVTGHPERCAPTLHVTGSKGKGSVTLFTCIFRCLIRPKLWQQRQPMS